jgi:hypothetical protein
MANTTYFGWETPDDTDLVKDGAAAIRTLGQAIDTSMQDLEGGTTGQILSKNSNADMDFVWVTNDVGDITAVTAGTGITGGGTSGAVTVSFDQANFGGGQFAAGKNKVINGNMILDQRNTASSAITINGSNIYTLDRWVGFGQAADGVFTVQQDSSAPTGFTKSLKATVTTADASIAATQSYFVAQRIEGPNIFDFAFGSAGAKTITVSFWVRSSLTGTFGASIRNGTNDRSYVFSYSISVADTWEKKTATIPGDTTGTWLTDNTTGLQLTFGLGQGTDRAETAGAWYASNRVGVTGQTQVIGTLNATWYVTGVQLEIGNVATPFQTATGTLQGELAACQRYYYRATIAVTPSRLGVGIVSSTTNADLTIFYPVPMRTSPTALEQNGTATDYSVITSGNTITICNAVPNFGNASTTQAQTNFPVASGLVAGQACLGRPVNTNAYLGWSAEL